MPRPEDELSWVCSRPLVCLPRQSDLLGTHGIGALANDDELTAHLIKGLVEFLDALIDLPVHRLVAGHLLRPFVRHPRGSSSACRSPAAPNFSVITNRLFRAMTCSIEPSSCPNAARPRLPFARTFSYSPSVSNTTSLQSCLGHSHRNGTMDASSTRSSSSAARSSFSFARRNTPSLSAFRSAGVFPSAVICSIFRTERNRTRSSRHPPVLGGRGRGLGPAKPYTTRVDPRGQLASRSLLLDDPEALISLHHCLDLPEHVGIARSDKKTLRIGPDHLVVPGRQRNPLRTCVVGAFAHPVAKRHVLSEGTVYFFHALVDVAKQTLRPGAKRRIVKLPLLQNGRSLHGWSQHRGMASQESTYGVAPRLAFIVTAIYVMRPYCLPLTMPLGRSRRRPGRLRSGRLTAASSPLQCSKCCSVRSRQRRRRQAGRRLDVFPPADQAFRVVNSTFRTT